MTRLAILGAAALAVSALASPAMAWVHHSGSSYHAERGYRHPHRAYYPANPAYQQQAYQQQAWNNGYYNRAYYNQGTGFWPADVAAGAVGTAGAIAAGAVNTAGAIATAPFRPANSYGYYPANSYAYYNGYNAGWPQQTYAGPNGFACTPGTYFMGADGRRHLCR
ncbi:hypothetical protein [Bradyrhizobium sp. ARR65]|uniref:hypothetical protein n=1 Tax=Bradyrhizobium sp. ARR65 TaxID=1040989 RepID=UPI0004661EDA|nr:hypothetical protein [Bradyrhizobium sp. ARR65]